MSINRSADNCGDTALEGSRASSLSEDELNEISALKYEQAYERLESIVDRMGEASVPLDELMTLYERGMALGMHCEKLLSGYEARMEMVSKRIMAEELDKIGADEADAAEPPEDF